MRWPRTVAAAAVVVALVSAATGATVAAFSDTSSNGSNTFTAQKIFAGLRTTSALTVNDQANGTTTNASDTIFAVNGGYSPTGNWQTTYSSSRYVLLDYMGTLPAGLAVTSPTLRFDVSAAAAGNTLCFYFDLVKTSTGTVVASHGSSATPVGCVTGTTITAYTTALPEITTTDIANDVTIKVYAKDSGSGAMRVDRAVLTGNTPYDAFTLYRSAVTDVTSGTPIAAPWSLAAAEGTALTTANNFTNAFGSTRYEEMTFPTNHVTASGTVNSVGLTVKFKAATSGRTLCVYYEAYSGSTLLGTYGSSGSPYCSDTANTWRTDTITLTGVDTPAEVNGLKIRVYGKTSVADKGMFDFVQLRPNYQYN